MGIELFKAVAICYYYSIIRRSIHAWWTTGFWFVLKRLKLILTSKVFWRLLAFLNMIGSNIALSLHHICGKLCPFYNVPNLHWTAVTCPLACCFALCMIVHQDGLIYISCPGLYAHSSLQLLRAHIQDLDYMVGCFKKQWSAWQSVYSDAIMEWSFNPSTYLLHIQADPTPLADSWPGGICRRGLDLSVSI
jgi:hypothetical protein